MLRLRRLWTASTMCLMRSSCHRFDILIVLCGASPVYLAVFQDQLRHDKVGDDLRPQRKPSQRVKREGKAIATMLDTSFGRDHSVGHFQFSRSSLAQSLPNQIYIV